MSQFESQAKCGYLGCNPPPLDAVLLPQSDCRTCIPDRRLFALLLVQQEDWGVWEPAGLESGTNGLRGPPPISQKSKITPSLHLPKPGSVHLLRQDLHLRLCRFRGVLSVQYCTQRWGGCL